MKRVLVGVLIALSLSVTACEPPPKCLKSHTTSGYEYTPECGFSFDGKYDCGKLKLKYVTRTVCDKWEEPAKEGESN